jgi:hypothetical protein
MRKRNKPPLLLVYSPLHGYAIVETNAKTNEHHNLPRAPRSNAKTVSRLFICERENCPSTRGGTTYTFRGL